MVGVVLKLTGVDESLATLQGMVRRARNPEPLWRKVGAQLALQVSERFETGTAPDGSTWPKSLRVKMMQQGQTLMKSGYLRDSITATASNDGVIIHTNVKYAAIHQFGGTIHHPARQRKLFFRTDKKGKIRPGFVKEHHAKLGMKVESAGYEIKMPARPFMGLNSDSIAQITGAAADYLILGEGQVVA